MAVRFETNRPQALLDRIKKLIEDGKIETWSCDKDGDFTHAVKQWENRAWLRPSVGSSQLSFYIIPPKATAISKTVYAVYHGRFIEMVLTHCDGDFIKATATSMPEGKDKVQGS